MGIRKWLGISRPRDAPEKEIPDIQDNVRDSGTLFVFGRANSGEQVDEKSAMRIATVYACVRLLAESVAQDRKSTRLNSSHTDSSRMPSSA